MKRYWKLAMFFALTVLCIGTFYVKAAGADQPDFYLKTLAGNEKEAAHVSVAGMYTDGRISIGQNGTEYRGGQSFWKWHDPNLPYNKEIEKLVKENSSFMRGKKNPYGLYEDDSVIGYVNIEPQFSSQTAPANFRIQVSTYDKKRKNGSSFEIKLPKIDVHDFINVQDVQIKGNQLKLLTFIYSMGGNNPARNQGPDAHLYTIDLEQKSLSEDQILLSGSAPDNNHRADMMNVAETDRTRTSRYAVFQRVIQKLESSTQTSISFRPEKRELFLYDMETGKTESIANEQVNGYLAANVEPNVTHIGDELLLLSGTDSMELRVLRYSLAEKKVNSEFKIDAKTLETNGMKGIQSRIAANRLYLSVGLSVAVVDLDTGQMVYQGVISRKNNEPPLNLMIEGITQ